MSGGEMAYLGLVLGAFLVFAGVLGWVSLTDGRSRRRTSTDHVGATTPRVSAPASS